MADKKVSELTEEKDLNKVQSIGVKTVDGHSTACRYDLGRVDERLMTALNGILANDSGTDFDISRTYYSGQFCRKEGQLWRFVKPHFAGNEWKGSEDAVQTTYSAELNSIMSNEFETLSAIVDFYNSDGTRASDADTLRNGKNVELYFDDGNSCIQTTGADGVAVFTIKKGTHFVLASQEVENYSRTPNADYIASISTSSVGSRTYGGRIVNLNYRKGVSRSESESTVTAHIRIDGTYSTMASAYNGQPASLIFPHGEYDKRSTLPAINTTISYNNTTHEATAVFAGVKQGEYCTVYIPTLPGYEQVASVSLTAAYTYDNKGFFVSGRDYDTYIDVTYDNNYGIFYLCGCAYDGQGTQITPASAAWKEFRIADYPGYGTETKCVSSIYPCVAVHVKTPALAAYNSDYYVKTRDLTTERQVLARQWCVVNQMHPHVSLDYYDITNPTLRPRTAAGANGRLATAYMMLDSNRIYGTTSPAAEWAVTQTFTFNERLSNQLVSHGFIGTRDQWQPLFDAYQELNEALIWFGYAGQNYRSGTSFWSSSQYSATFSWDWHSSSNWNIYYKTTSYTVLPFFAI